MSDVSNFLAPSGIPACKFPAIGTTVTGKIVAPPEVQQQTEIGTGRPLTFDDGKPRQQLVITIQTDQRDPEISDDDGQRRVFVTGTKASEGGGMLGAFKRAGITDLQVGGTLTVKYTHDGARTSPAYSPPKQYEASYAPPNAAAGFLGGGATNGAATEQLPPGMTPEVWATLTPEVQAALKGAVKA